MAKCPMHPSQDATLTLLGVGYCSNCEKLIADAQKRVDKHVEPKTCFIWYVKNNDWEPIEGTGCAHWVSHELGIKKGGPGDKCLAGYTYRVGVMLGGHSEVKKLTDVKVNDIYATPDKKHCGLVIKVTAPKKARDDPDIIIKHDSSAQGKVATDPFAVRFKSKGTFWR